MLPGWGHSNASSEVVRLEGGEEVAHAQAQAEGAAAEPRTSRDGPRTGARVRIGGRRRPRRRPETVDRGSPETVSKRKSVRENDDGKSNEKAIRSDSMKDIKSLVKQPNLQVN